MVKTLNFTNKKDYVDSSEQIDTQGQDSWHQISKKLHLK